MLKVNFFGKKISRSRVRQISTPPQIFDFLVKREFDFDSDEKIFFLLLGYKATLRKMNKKVNFS